MQKDEVLEFLGKIDAFLYEHYASRLDGKPFELKIFGKSALLLAGLVDSVGTNDIDILQVDGQHSPGANKEIVKGLTEEFGRTRTKVHGYYLEFVSPAIVFLSQKPEWIPLGQTFKHLEVSYLEPHHVIASKLFSAFSPTMPRKKDKQDIVAALDQKLVTLGAVCAIADKVFDRHRGDAREDRFPAVYDYLTKELMTDYGKAELEFKPDEN